MIFEIIGIYSLKGTVKKVPTNYKNYSEIDVHVPVVVL